MADIDITMLGDKELANLFQTLPDKLQKRLVKQSLRRAGKIVLSDAKRLVGVKSGALKKSLKLRAIRRNRSQIIGWRVDLPRRAALNIAANDPYYYPAIVEYGHKGAKPHPFLRPAIFNNKQKCIDMVRADIRKFVDEEMMGKK